MAYRNIAQIAPNAATSTDLYTVPSAKQAIISTIVICNQNTTNQTVRVSLRSGTAASGSGTSAIGSTATPSGSSYILYDTLVYAKSSLALTMGVTATDGEIVTVYASTNNISFLLFGSVLDI